MIKRKILVVGHPRTGTGYMSALLTSAGLDVGHERIGKDGISCWLFATENDNYASGISGDIKGKTRKDFQFDYIIHSVKNPYTCMSSIVNVENEAKASLAYRKKHVYINDNGTRLEKAVQSFLGWHKLIEDKIKADCIIQVENAPEQLKQFLISKNILAAVEYKTMPSNKYNTRRNKKQYKEITQHEWDSLPIDLKNRLDAFCEKYKYSK
jgi:hypothetical protein